MAQALPSALTASRWLLRILIPLNLLFGALIIVAMVVRPSGFLDAAMLKRFARWFSVGRDRA